MRSSWDGAISNTSTSTTTTFLFASPSPTSPFFHPYSYQSPPLRRSSHKSPPWDSASPTSPTKTASQARSTAMASSASAPQDDDTILTRRLTLLALVSPSRRHGFIGSIQEEEEIVDVNISTSRWDEKGLRAGADDDDDDRE